MVSSPGRWIAKAAKRWRRNAKDGTSPRTPEAAETSEETQSRRRGLAGDIWYNARQGEFQVLVTDKAWTA